MECGRSPLVSIARVSAGRGATDRNGDRYEEAGTETATGFKRRSGWATTVAPGSPDKDIVALRPGAGLSLTARSEANWLGKRTLNPGCEAISTFNGYFQRADAPSSGRIRWPQGRWLAGLRFNFR